MGSSRWFNQKLGHEVLFGYRRIAVPNRWIRMFLPCYDPHNLSNVPVLAPDTP
ncbi:MAG: hypothetical protein R3B90_00945 [Planctomycetaceae bacterium]